MRRSSGAVLVVLLWLHLVQVSCISIYCWNKETNQNKTQDATCRVNKTRLWCANGLGLCRGAADLAKYDHAMATIDGKVLSTHKHGIPYFKKKVSTKS
jgi:hypothetical protein